ncbi:MAG: hypothetical protein M1587_07310 [Thaumarchaeota archaeon]|nr:hypothetical protein [Nitrososphaerota archaeon]
MSEEVSFRLRIGQNEFEVKGQNQAVNSLLDGKLSHLLKAFESAISRADLSARASDDAETDNVTETGKQKSSKRGGARSSRVSLAIDSIIDSGFFKVGKSTSEIVEYLKNKGVGGVDVTNVNVACMRRARTGKLDTYLENGQRYFIEVKGKKG